MHLLTSLFAPKTRDFLPPLETRLVGPRVILRATEMSDWRHWRALRDMSRDFLAPWEPEWPAQSLTASFFAAMLRHQGRDWRRGKAYGFLIFLQKESNHPPLAGGPNFSRQGGENSGRGKKGDPSPAKTKDLLRKSKFSLPPPQGGRDTTGALVGGITLNDVRRGIAQKASLGYWVGLPYARQGLMTEAAGLVCDFAFRTLKLHRVEASCLPHNDASKQLLKRLGFEEEGFAKSYLRIDGAWQNHMLWGKIAPAETGNGLSG